MPDQSTAAPVSARPPIHDFRAEIEELLPLGGDYFRLRLIAAPGIMARAVAGCFVMVESPGCALRRPFSLLDNWPAKNPRDASRFDILFKIVGDGTRRLAELKPGAQLATLGPLGHGFLPPPSGVRAVCVGGGFGLAPFKLALRQWSDNTAGPAIEPPPIIFAGARTMGDLPFKSLLDEAVNQWPGAKLVVSTEDGSLGEKGLVTAALVPFLNAAREANERVRIYSCGPTGMLRAVGRLAEERGLVAMLSLEANMACGYGVCNGCVVPRRTADGSKSYVRICVDGPVFPSTDVDL